MRQKLCEIKIWNMKAEKGYLTLDEIMQNDSLSELRAVALFLDTNKDKILFPEKFMGSLKNIVSREINELFDKSPDTPLVNVVTAMLTGMNEKMSPQMILEITDFIISKWQNLSAPKLRKVGELELA